MNNSGYQMFKNISSSLSLVSIKSEVRNLVVEKMGTEDSRPENLTVRNPPFSFNQISHFKPFSKTIIFILLDFSFSDEIRMASSLNQALANISSEIDKFSEKIEIRCIESGVQLDKLQYAFSKTESRIRGARIEQSTSAPNNKNEKKVRIVVPDEVRFNWLDIYNNAESSGTPDLYDPNSSDPAKKLVSDQDPCVTQKDSNDQALDSSSSSNKNIILEQEIDQQILEDLLSNFDDIFNENLGNPQVLVEEPSPIDNASFRVSFGEADPSILNLFDIHDPEPLPDLRSFNPNNGSADSFEIIHKVQPIPQVRDEEEKLKPLSNSELVSHTKDIDSNQRETHSNNLEDDILDAPGTLDPETKQPLPSSSKVIKKPSKSDSFDLNVMLETSALALSTNELSLVSKPRPKSLVRMLSKRLINLSKWGFSKP
ncbi:hypothetical protein AYI68_g3506 [Smittium mucronatum]|uniref:Uncharacterized protein n=1 Tax=Smittium mucronatum TaxID=133383 RepID=A0A1R0GZQ8_9FUNG|nr:hypothetical protein AYI68_g3506 [Smittium mucronatum]